MPLKIIGKFSDRTTPQTKIFITLVLLLMTVTNLFLLYGYEGSVYGIPEVLFYIWQILLIVLVIIILGRQPQPHQNIMRQAALFQDLFDNSPLPYQIFNNKGKIIDINKNWLKQTGYSKDEVLGKNFSEFLVEEEKEFFKERLVKIYELGFVPHVNYNITKKNGEIILTSHIGEISDSTNNIHCVFQDITIQKEYENTIRNQNYFLNTVIESLDHPFYVVNIEDYSIELANSRARKLNPFAGKCYSLGHKTDEPCWKEGELCPLKMIKSNGKPVIIEHVHYDEDGKPFHVEIHGYPIFDAEGKITKIIEYTLDITERKLAEEALINSETKFRQLAENIDEIFWLRTKEKIEYISPAYEKTWGKSLQSLYSNPLSYTDSIHPEDKSVMDIFREDKEFYSNEIIGFRYRIIKPDNSMRWIWSRSFPIYDADNKITKRAGIAIDITDQKRHDEIMENVIQGISSAVGDKFFELIIYYLGKTLNADFAFVGEINLENKNIIETKAVYDGGQIGKNFSFSLSGSPCKDVLNFGKCSFTENAASLFPEDTLLSKMKIEAYVGVPLLNMNNEPIGIMAGLYSKKIDDISRYENILKIFANRTSTEIDRLKSERELKKSEEKYRSLFKNMLDSFAYHKIVVDKNGKPIDYIFLETNDEFHKMLGIKREDVIGRKVTEVIPGIGNDSTDWIGIYGKVALSGEIKRMESYSSALKKWYSVAIYCPEPGYFATLFEDITGRKKAEEAIREIDKGISSQLGEKFFESMTQKLSLILKSNYTFIGELNDEKQTVSTISFCKEGEVIKNVTFPVTRTACEDVIKNGFTSFTINGGKEYINCELDIEGHINSFVGVALKDKNNKTIGMIVSIFTYKVDDIHFAESIQKIFAVRTATEIQRRKIERELDSYRLHLEKLVKDRTGQLEKEIEKQKESEKIVLAALTKEKELSELKSRFISTTSHEFRTPLSTILSSTELIGRYGKTWDENTFVSQISKITRSVDYLTELLDDILIISRADTGKLRFTPTELNLRNLCKNIVQDNKHQLKSNQDLDYNYLPDEDIFILDEKLIKQILSNLISNAIKYSSESGIIRFNVEKKDGYINFHISDNGIGIPEEDKKYLFQPFHRGKNVADISGTGLGLSIVYKSVELHQGNITFNSAIDKGTAFNITIPII